MHTNRCPQDWLYEDGEDTTKAAYIAKMDEIRFVAGPIVQRHLDKLEAERQAKQKEEEERQAKIRAEVEARKKAEEEKKAAEAAAQKKEGGDAMETDPPNNAEKPDAEMKDASSAADPPVE
jgi:heat shock 70kDa protein 4